jgi:hypothetical protein
VDGWFKAFSRILVAFATCGVMFLDITTTTTYAPIPSKTLILFCQLLASLSFSVSNLDVHWMTIWFLLAKYICTYSNTYMLGQFFFFNAFGNVNFWIKQWQHLYFSLSRIYVPMGA